MSDGEYITISRYYSPKGRLSEDRELQLNPNPDEDAAFDSKDFTSLRVHSRETGDPISGEAVLSPDELAVLYTWAGKRLTELRHPAAAPQATG